MKRFLMLAVLAVAGLVYAQQAGQPAPDFRMYDTKGNIVKLSSFKGKPVIVTFWATWCEVCAVEMPELNRRYAKLKDKLVFLAVSRDASQPAAEVIAFTKTKSWGFSHVLVNPPEGAKNVDTIAAVTARYGIYGQPWSFFVDAKGTVRAVHAGLSTEAQFRGYLSKIGVQ